MPNVVIFCGPSIDAGRARAILPDASIRGPAGCGDVLRATLEGARVIGLIDGYFDHRLSVWHKEVLWAIARNVAVYGASSMGALRAAELAPFGMIGVGRIFESYVSGELEDDDEVAVTHQSAEHDYRSTSQAMVNVRATIALVVSRGVLTEREGQLLLSRMKARFYPDRNDSALRADAREVLPHATAGALAQWLDAHGIINQKLEDAEVLLRRVADDERAGRHAASSSDEHPFPHTNAWETLVRQVCGEAAATRMGQEERPISPRPGPEGSDGGKEGAPDIPGIEPRQITSDPRRAGVAQVSAVWELARDQAFALALAQNRGITVDAARVQEEADRVRRRLGLLTPAETAAWLSENGLDVSGFSRLIHDSVLTSELQGLMQQAVESQVLYARKLLGVSTPAPHRPERPAY